MSREIIEKIFKKDPENLGEENFYFIGSDSKNPWEALSTKLTPKDILELTSLGIRIIATPHIGLHWPSNSAYPKMGVQIVDYTGNQSFLDTADEPEKVKEGGVSEIVSIQDIPVLSPYLVIDHQKTKGFSSQKIISDFTNLASLHHKLKQKALGEENVKTDFEALFQFPFVEDFFAILLKEEKEILKDYSSGILDRFVSQEGVVSRISNSGDVNSFLKMKEAQNGMIQKDEVNLISGFLPIKETMILLDSIASFYIQLQKGLVSEKQDLATTYTVSGADMINYTKNPNLREIVQKMYKCLKKDENFKKWLPKNIQHIMIPGAVFRFLPSKQETKLADSVYVLFKIYKNIKEKNLKISSANEEEKGELIQEKLKLNEDFKKAKEEFDLRAKNRSGFSQYDLTLGDSISEKVEEILPEIMEMTFEEIDKLFKY